MVMLTGLHPDRAFFIWHWQSHDLVARPDRVFSCLIMWLPRTPGGYRCVGRWGSIDLTLASGPFTS